MKKLVLPVTERQKLAVCGTRALLEHRRGSSYFFCTVSTSVCDINSDSFFFNFCVCFRNTHLIIAGMLKLVTRVPRKQDGGITVSMLEKHSTTTTIEYFISPHGYYNIDTNKYTDKYCWVAGCPK